MIVHANWVLLGISGKVGPTSGYETSMCLQQMHPKLPCYDRFILTSVAHELHSWNVDDCLRKLGLPGWVGATGVGDISG